MSDKTKAILTRFGKAAVAGALSQMGLITIITPSNLTQVSSILASLAFSAFSGALTGVIMAGQKWYSWKDEELI